MRVKLSQRFVDSLDGRNGDRVYFDVAIPGFGVRTKSTGKKAYIIQYRNRGRSRRFTLGSCATLRLEQARASARKHLVEVYDGKDPADQKKLALQDPTVSELAKRYIEAHAIPKKKPSSVRTDRGHIRNHIVPAFGSMKVVDVSRTDIAELHYRLRNTPGAANRAVALLSKMFNLAEKWGLRPDGSNPCRHIERYPERKLNRFLSPEEMARLGNELSLAEQRQTEMPSAVAAIRLLLLTGARLGEILGLRWDYIRFDQSLALLPDSKTGPRPLYFNLAAVRLLRDLKERSMCDWVVEGEVPGAPLVNLRKPWHRIRKRANLEDVRLHDLRHTFASFAAAGGMSLPMIGKLLNHTQPVTTQRYSHLAHDPVRQANELLGTQLRQLLDSGREN
ncbi:MAG: site-specific integrase [Alphaproteobacteria bacterium]